MKDFNQSTIIKISYPYEYFDTQVSFAMKISQTIGIPIDRAMLDYTDLYSSLTNKKYGEDEEEGIYSPIWNGYIQQIEGMKNTKDISQSTYDLFLKQKHSIIEIKKDRERGENTFGCFKIDYGEYNRQREQIRLHFTPLRLDLLKEEEEKYGDLSTKYLPQRKEEFKQIIKHIHDNPDLYKGAKYFTSSTWLQNIPNYQSLFPGKYSLDENRIKKDSGYLGLWGQFIKWDLSPNIDIYAKFKENLEKTKSIEEVINAFPYPVYEIRIPLKELYEIYN